MTLHDHIYIVTLTYPLASNPLSRLRDQQATWGQSGVEVSKPAGYAVCDGNVSSCFCFVLVFVLFVCLFFNNNSSCHRLRATLKALSYPFPNCHLKFYILD